MVRQARLPLLTFAVLTTGIYAVAVTMTRMRSVLREPEIVSLGLLFDLLVTVPLAYYLLAVRRAGWPARTLIPLFLFSLTGAALVLPDQREMLKRFSEAVSIPAELGLLTWITVRTVRSFRRASGPGADDVLQRLKMVAREILPARVAADAIASEMAVFYYAFFAWRRRTPSPPASRVFTYHRTGGYGAIVFALMMVTAGESIPVHLLVARWSPQAAWTLTILAAYTMLWLLADYRATRRRPILLDAETLSIRTGLRWTVSIPRAHIVAIHKKAPQKSEPRVRTALPMTTPLWIELAEPVTAHGPYGITRRARWISVSVDEAKAFQEALAGPPAS
jgi:hypothetical protein